MRLTPSWLRSSSDTPPEECGEDSEGKSRPEVTVSFDPGDDFGIGSTDPGDQADEFLPDTDAALLTVIEDMQLPVTVDEITDRLIEPAQPPIDTWAAVHERLHRTRLPALDAADEIEFDDAQGIVERSEPQTGGVGPFSQTGLGTISAIVLLAVFLLVSVSMVTVLMMTLGTLFVV